MVDIKQVYDALTASSNGALTAHTRKGDLDKLVGGMLDKADAQCLLEYSRRQEAEKLVKPYLLSDYLCYMYDGTPQGMADAIGVSLEHLDKLMYNGCYWHDGGILVPTAFERADEEIERFMEECLTFGKGAIHASELWVEYKLFTGAQDGERPAFKKKIYAILHRKGYYRQNSVRSGKSVNSGYKGISVKSI